MYCTHCELQRGKRTHERPGICGTVTNKDTRTQLILAKVCTFNGICLLYLQCSDNAFGMIVCGRGTLSEAERKTAVFARSGRICCNGFRIIAFKALA